MLFRSHDELLKTINYLNLRLLRTVLSEHDGIFVRTRGYFGQLYEEMTRFCPNPGLLRTTLRGIPRDSVRTRGYFGQLYRNTSGFCPNPGLLRTTLQKNLGILSEPGATSDNFTGIPRDSVRTWSYFGQLYRNTP